MSTRLPVFPNFFNLFINALIENIKKLGLGVKCGELILALLKFADDIALMAETENDLQCMLNALHFWCEYWLLHINIGKEIFFTPDKSPSLEPVFNSNVALQK